MMEAEKTVVMPAGMGEIQGQLEIAFSQIKNLNRKMVEMEALLDSLARQNANKLELNELKEPPMNPADFTQKLLKLAEHVIIIDQENACDHRGYVFGLAISAQTRCASAVFFDGFTS